MKTGCEEEQRTEGHHLNPLARESKRRCEDGLTKYVGFNGQREVRVISEDVNSFGDGDVVKVLAIDLHDLRQDGENDRFYSVIQFHT